jgi:hypothetical protein
MLQACSESYAKENKENIMKLFTEIISQVLLDEKSINSHLAAFTTLIYKNGFLKDGGLVCEKILYENSFVGSIHSLLLAYFLEESFFSPLKKLIEDPLGTDRAYLEVLLKDVKSKEEKYLEAIRENIANRELKKEWSSSKVSPVDKSLIVSLSAFTLGGASLLPQGEKLLENIEVAVKNNNFFRGSFFPPSKDNAEVTLLCSLKNRKFLTCSLFVGGVALLTYLYNKREERSKQL